MPAFSRTINELETALGAKLFDRSKAGVRLSPYGETFLHHDMAALAELGAGVAHVETLAQSELGQVRVGALPTSLNNLLPLSVAALKRSHPTVTVNIASGINDLLLPFLKAGEIDMVVGRKPHPDPGRQLE